MSKFTEQDVQAIAIEYANALRSTATATDASFDAWWAGRESPKSKIIDMTHFIKSGIDCEFWSTGWEEGEDTWVPYGSLVSIDSGKYFAASSEKTTGWFSHCRPRMNHKMFHDGGECPLPEGFEVALYYRGGQAAYTIPYIDNKWNHDGLDGDIIGYKILGLADGWAYPYQESKL